MSCHILQNVTLQISDFWLKLKKKTKTKGDKKSWIHRLSKQKKVG